MKLEKGFTLIELMIVICVVGILASIAYPSYQTSVRKSCRNDARSALLEIASLQEKNYFRNQQYSTDLSYSGGLSYTDTDESPEGCYTLAVTYQANGACADEMNCYTIAATAIGSQLQDETCRTFRMNSLGQKTALDDGNVDTTAICW